MKENKKTSIKRIQILGEYRKPKNSQQKSLAEEQIPKAWLETQKFLEENKTSKSWLETQEDLGITDGLKQFLDSNQKYYGAGLGKALETVRKWRPDLLQKMVFTKNGDKNIEPLIAVILNPGLGFEIGLNELTTEDMVEAIKGFSDETILGLAMENKDHKGQYGFLLNAQVFSLEVPPALEGSSAILLERGSNVDEETEYISLSVESIERFTGVKEALMGRLLEAQKNIKDWESYIGQLRYLQMSREEGLQLSLLKEAESADKFGRVLYPWEDEGAELMGIIKALEKI